MSYVPPHALVSLVLSRFLAKHFKGQFRLLIPVAPYWIESSWLPVFQVSITKGTSNARRNRPVCLLQRMYEMTTFLPLNWQVSWFINLGLDWLGTVSIYYSAISVFEVSSSLQGFKSSYYL